jgi:hypothetical protein
MRGFLRSAAQLHRLDAEVLNEYVEQTLGYCRDPRQRTRRK